jgi:hypothetical protein
MGLLRKVLQGIRKPKCPVNDVDKTWIERRLNWLISEFGTEPLRNPILIPTEKFFPSSWSGTDNECFDLVDRLCRFMAVDSSRILVQIYSDNDQGFLKHLPAYQIQHSGPAGLFCSVDNQLMMGIAESGLARPPALVATICHELGHVHLLGDKRLDNSEMDHEPLTDLLAIYFGAGLFIANSAFEFNQWQYGQHYGWSTSRLGYLNEAQLGYALAVHAWLRGEDRPSWHRFLADNIKDYFDDALDYLLRTKDTTLKFNSAGA